MDRDGWETTCFKNVFVFVTAGFLTVYRTFMYLLWVFPPWDGSRRPYFCKLFWVTETLIYGVYYEISFLGNTLIKATIWNKIGKVFRTIHTAHHMSLVNSKYCYCYYRVGWTSRSSPSLNIYDSSIITKEWRGLVGLEEMEKKKKWNWNQIINKANQIIAKENSGAHIPAFGGNALSWKGGIVWWNLCPTVDMV